MPRKENYKQMVLRLRALKAKAFEALVELRDALLDVRDNETWRGGPYQSFERFMTYEIGWSAQRFRHLDSAINRFGRDLVGLCGAEVAITMLRLPEDTPVERRVLGKINDMIQERGGRGPSQGAVKDLLKKELPQQRPVGRPITEVDRLREVVLKLEQQLREEKKAHAITKKALSEARKKKGRAPSHPEATH